MYRGRPLWSYREDISEAIICPPQRRQGQPAPPRRAFCSQRRFPSEHGNNQPIRDWEQSLLDALPEHKRIAQRRRRPCKKQELPPARIYSGLAASVRLTAYSEIPVMSASFGKCCEREAGLSTADYMAIRLSLLCALATGLPRGRSAYVLDTCGRGNFFFFFNLIFKCYAMYTTRNLVLLVRDICDLLYCIRT